MKNDVLSSWLKELCSLVFVQTFQAFLLAIVMSIIISALASSESGTIDACGLLAIIALSSFSKIELLLKNIFGLTSSYGDPSLVKGTQSFAGGMATLWGARRLLDNPRKIASGGLRAIKGRVRMAKTKHDYLEAAAARGIGEQSNGGNQGTQMTLGQGAVVASQVNSAGKISELSTAITNLTTAVNNNTSTNNQNARSDSLDKLKQAIDDAKKERNEGLKSMVTGVAETVGALHGAVAGGIVGLAQGEDLGKLTQSIIHGAGAGDIIGDTVTNITVNGIPDIAKTVKDAVKEGERSIKNKDAYDKIERNLKNENSKRMNEINKKLDMYKRNANSNSSSVDDIQ